MTAKEIKAKTILRRLPRVDSWFVSGCGMNLYRGCAHDCAYCDGRAEKYRVEGEFGVEVSVKVNAVEVLGRELGPGPRDAEAKNGELWPELAPERKGRRRSGGPRPCGFVIAGGGVGDAYQPLEKEYRLTRRVLELLLERRLPVHVLTKSTLVLRDADLLERINSVSRAVVSFSICGADDEACAVFEPGVPPSSKRLAALSELGRRGIPGGIYLMPVIPFVTDTEEAIDRSVREAAAAGARFVVFGGMTMKEGRQKTHFLRIFEGARPGSADRCRALYANRDPWGNAEGGYYARIQRAFGAAARRYGMPPRMPLELFSGLLGRRDLAVVLLEHMHAMRELEGRTSPFRAAAFKLSRLAEPLSVRDGALVGAEGIGKTAAAAIGEILETGTCALYLELLAAWSRL